MKKCGRPVSSRIHEFFNYDPEENSSKCQYGGCNQEAIKGKHAGNLAKHLKSSHPKEYRQYLEMKSEPNQDEQSSPPPKRARGKIKITRDQFRKSCVKLVTLNGRPFSLFKDEGFREIIDPILETFPESEKFTISPEILEDEVSLEATAIRKQIKEELKKVKLISVKCDVASRHSRSFLGVNIQFIKDEKIQLRTLAVKVLEERHTSDYLRYLIREILEMYEIRVGDMYTCTTDNGANMIKMTSLLQEEQEENESSREKSNSNDEQEIEVNISECLHEFVEHPESAIDLDGQNIFLICVRCGAHTLQLCVTDVLKEKLVKTIDKARTVIKVLRTETMVKILISCGYKKPVLDMPTRWSTTDIMLQSLMDVKPFCLDFSSTHEELHLSEVEWERIEQCLAALEPSRIATLLLQKEQLLPGDFFGAWLKCKLETKKVNTPFARALFNAMESREAQLLDNDALLAALYLDPRYLPYVLHRQEDEEENQSKEIRARNKLKQIWLKLHPKEQETSDVTDEIQSQEILQGEEDQEEADEVDEMLKAYDHERHTKRKEKDASHYIETLLLNFRTTPKLDRKSNILSFWRENKITMPELYELAMIAQAVPMTQVSVERLFSGMKFIFSDLRSKLSPDMLDDILVVRCNGLYKKEPKTVNKAKTSAKKTDAANRAG